MTASPDRDSFEPGTGREGERDLCKEVETFVRRQPWRALSIAIAIGFVIGRFIL